MSKPFLQHYVLEDFLKGLSPSSVLKELSRKPELFINPIDRKPRDHSKDMDGFLGFKISQIEQGLLKKYQAYYKQPNQKSRKKHYQGTQTWIGLNPQALQTPYPEIVEFINLLKPFSPQSFVDLGAGYGRLGIVLKALLPSSSFIGYEILPDRICEARRIFNLLEMESSQMREENILAEDFILPRADVYFIYDFSDPKDLRIILKQLSNKIHKDRFMLVVRGKGIRSLIQLKYPEFWACHGAIHKKNWSLFSSYRDLI